MEGNSIGLSVSSPTYPDHEQPSDTILLIGSGVTMVSALSRACRVRALADALRRRGVSEVISVPKQQDLEHFFAVPGNIARSILALLVDIGLPIDSNESLRIAQSLRRDYRLRLPIIFWTAPMPVSSSLNAPNVPGSYRLPFPARFCDLVEFLDTVQPISDEATLREVIRRYCRFEERHGVLLHDLLNAIGARKVPQARELSRQLAALVEGTDDQEAQAAIAQAEALIAAAEADVTQAPTNSRPVPSEWRSILIVDDNGYSPATIAALKAKGYAPLEVVETFEEGAAILEDDPPDVLLCDYRLQGDPAQGVELVRRALACEDVKAVILISAEPIPQEDVLPGVVSLDGLEKFDAGRIHALIVGAAQRQKPQQ